MKKNPVIECILSHKSIRNFTDQNLDQETVETIVRAGQQAPFAIRVTESYSIGIMIRIHGKLHFSS